MKRIRNDWFRAIACATLASAGTLISAAYANAQVRQTALYIDDGSGNILRLVTGGLTGNHTFSFGAPSADARAVLTSDSSTAGTGDLLYWDNTSSMFKRLAIGSSTQVLTVSGGVPAWNAAPSPMPLIISAASVGNLKDGTYARPMGPGIASNATLDPSNMDEMVMPVGGTLKNLYVAVEKTPTSGKDYMLVVVVNGSQSSLAVDITSGSTTGSDLTHSVTVSAGDLVSMYMTHATASAANCHAMWSMELAP